MSARRVAVAGIALVAAGVLGGASWRDQRPTAASRLEHSNAEVRRFLERDAESLDASIVAPRQAVATSTQDSIGAQRVRAAYRSSRMQYKRIEAEAEFYAPAVAAALNSRRQEVDDDDAPPPSTLSAGGFPALDTLVWPAMDPANAGAVLHLVDDMHRPVKRLEQLATAIVPTDGQLIEFARLELARVSTMGIAGFDAPVTKDAMLEAAAALDGVRAFYADIGPVRWPAQISQRATLDSTLRRAVTYLQAHPEFETFDRLTFLAFYAQPAAAALNELREATGAVAVQIPRAWRATAASVYDANAFDTRVYAPSLAPVPSAALIALGRTLFSDPSLSGTGARSCASCHVPDRAFSDGVSRAASLAGHGSRVARNTPTLINAAIQPAQFDDERAVTLEDQVRLVLASPTEMASSLDIAATAISKRADYRVAFSDVFARASAQTEPAVTPERLQRALAAYVRSLVALDSRFDRAVRGDTAQMTAVERRGFNLFMGKAGCGTCHFAPLFSGDTPPLYLSSDVEVIGTAVSPAKPSVLDPDSGRVRIDHRPEHLRAFKTPSLRNVALTAPYMHNGTYSTLEQVIHFYDGGGGQGAGARIANQTLSADSLHLSTDEIRAIVQFLGTLTDTAGLTRIGRAR
ncbi:MAG TPA: cytochrome c peroxidase [Gemmatimonadaceae bacterium]